MTYALRRTLGRMPRKIRELLVLTGAIYAEIAVSGLSVFRMLLPRPSPWLEVMQPPPQLTRITD